MIDITLDLETCALAPTAAVMSVGAVLWKRDGDKSPFYIYSGSEAVKYPTFSAHVDLRGMFVDGFTFDKQTADWWQHESEEARASVLESDDDATLCSPIQTIVRNLFEWIKEIKDTLHDKDVCLWSQGSDFDIAILRNICYKYQLDINVLVHYTYFRDHRTFVYEAAQLLCNARGVPYSPKIAYDIVEDYKNVERGAEHDPVFDCKRSIYSTWQMMKQLNHLKYLEQ